MSEDTAGRVTAPRGWRPGPVYIAAAAFAILLILVWLFTRSPLPADLPAGAPPVTGPGR